MGYCVPSGVSLFSHLFSNLQSINELTADAPSCINQLQLTLPGPQCFIHFSVSSLEKNAAHALNPAVTITQAHRLIVSKHAVDMVPQVRNTSQIIALYINRNFSFTSLPANARRTSSTEHRYLLVALRAHCMRRQLFTLFAAFFLYIFAFDSLFLRLTIYFCVSLFAFAFGYRLCFCVSINIHKIKYFNRVNSWRRIVL